MPSSVGMLDIWVSPKQPLTFTTVAFIAMNKNCSQSCATSLNHDIFHQRLRFPSSVGSRIGTVAFAAALGAVCLEARSRERCDLPAASVDIPQQRLDFSLPVRLARPA